MEFSGKAEEKDDGESGDKHVLALMAFGFKLGINSSQHSDETTKCLTTAPPDRHFRSFFFFFFFCDF